MLAAVGAAGLVYYPVVNIWFFSDDFVHLIQIIEHSFFHFIMSLFGGHMYITRNVVFWLSWHAFGLNPVPYYVMALATHLLNTWLLFRLVRASTDDAVLACLGAAAFGTAPACVGTIGWYSVYGHALATTILLVVLLDLFRLEKQQRPPSAGRISLWAALLLVGTTCFGVGIGIALAFPVAAYLVAPASYSDRRGRWVLALLPVAVLALYWTCRQISSSLEPLRMEEVLIYEQGFSKLLPIVVMTGHLLKTGIAQLLPGFRFPATEHFTFAVTCWSIAVTTAFALASGRVRRQILALLAIAAGAYGIIAVGRANIRLEHYPIASAAMALRYHYAGLVPLVVVSCIALQWITRRLPHAEAMRWTLLGAWFVIAGTGSFRSDWRIDEHPECRSWFVSTLADVEHSIDSAPPGGDVVITNQHPHPGCIGLVLRPSDFPGSVAVFELAHDEDVVRGHHVRFVEPDLDFSIRIAADRYPRIDRLLGFSAAAP
ncbi:MAG TPA: hypothetical protein VN634_14695 [Candidatus Limnocylindrales bacterium]|nr:hypothetical protein [Candidatus Limnocylindrales bacterium]